MISILVSQRALDVLAAHDLTGWLFEPIHLVENRNITVFPTLYELVIDGRAGDVVRTPPLEIESVCPRCARVTYSPDVVDSDRAATARVNPETWDGSDFFQFSSAPLGGYFLVSERAATVLCASGLTNFELSDPIGRRMTFDLESAIGAYGRQPMGVDRP